MQEKNQAKIYFGYLYDGKTSYSNKINNDVKCTNPLKRNVLENLPNTGKVRKKNTHLKKRKKRK